MTRRRLARRSKSANGTPPAAPSAFTKTRPPSKARLVGLALLEWRSRRCRCDGQQRCDRIVSRGKDGWDHRSSHHRTARDRDLPEATCRRAPLPTLSSGTTGLFREPSCARIVYVPVPMSCVPHATRAVPSSRSWTLASAGNRAAIHAHPAIPQPRVQAIALHRADLGVALRPTELFRAKLEALEQMT